MEITPEFNYVKIDGAGLDVPEGEIQKRLLEEKIKILLDSYCLTGGSFERAHIFDVGWDKRFVKTIHIQPSKDSGSNGLEEVSLCVDEPHHAVVRVMHRKYTKVNVKGYDYIICFDRSP